MAISIDYSTKVITVPQTDLTFVSGTLYELDTEAIFRDFLLSEQASEQGIPFDTAFNHNTQVTIAGVTYARQIILINGYTVTFEDGQYAVRLIGSNNNIFDEGIINRNQVSIIPTNSAGLINVTKVDDMFGQIERSIWIDTTAIASGNGYQQSPYNTFTAAVDDAEANNIRSLVLLADATVDRQLKNFVFRGVGNPTLDANGQILDKSEFNALSITGSIGAASVIKMAECEILTGVTGLQGSFLFCGFGGIITLEAGSTTKFTDCYSTVAGLGRPTLNVNGGGCKISNRSYRGGLILTGATNALDEISVSMAQGRLQLAAGNTDGIISIRGLADLDDLSTGTTVEMSGLLEPSEIGNLVLNTAVEGAETFAQIVRLLRAAAAGSIAQLPDGSYLIKSADGTKDRITGGVAANTGRTISATDPS